jgi:hypothetical protein
VPRGKPKSGPLATTIGKTVTFKAPKATGGAPSRHGKVVDEVWDVDLAHHNNKAVHTQAQHQHCWGDYAFLSQLIEWDSGDRSIRMGYYMRHCGQDGWFFASQMTIEADPSTIEALCKGTLAKLQWFYPRRP